MRREHRTPAEIEAQIQAQIHAARDQIEATRARADLVVSGSLPD